MAKVSGNVSGSASDRIGISGDIAQSVDRKVPVFDVKTMEDRLDAVLARPKFYATAVTFFGGLALLLAGIGIYGTIGYAVAQRTRKMGIRFALGTTPARLRAAVFGRTFVVIGCGAAAGLAMALAGGQYLQSLIAGAEQGCSARPLASSPLRLRSAPSRSGAPPGGLPCCTSPTCCARKRRTESRGESRD